MRRVMLCSCKVTFIWGIQWGLTTKQCQEFSDVLLLLMGLESICILLESDDAEKVVFEVVSQTPDAENITLTSGSDVEIGRFSMHDITHIITHMLYLSCQKDEEDL